MQEHGTSGAESTGPASANALVPARPRDPHYAPAQPSHGLAILDLRSLVGVLRRAKFLIAGFTVLATGTSVVVSEQLTPRYAAAALIAIEPDRRNIVDIEKVAEGLPSDRETLETEATVIASRELARRAVERLDLMNDPDWNPTLEPAIEPQELVDAPIWTPPEIWLQQFASFAPLVAPYWEQVRVQWYRALDWLDEQGVVAMLGLGVEDEISPIDPAELFEQITEGYRAGLAVAPERGSRIVVIQYESTDPAFAALATNTTADIYIESQSRLKGEATSQADAWLSRQVAETEQRWLAADRKLEEFRRASGLTTVGNTVLPAQQLAEFSSELGRTRAALAEATARRAQVGELQSVAPENIATAAAVLQSPLVQALRVQEVELNRKLAELGSQYRDGHPQLVFATAERGNLRGAIAAEIDKIATNLANEEDVLKARVRALEGEVSRLQTELERLSAAEVTLRGLETEVQASQTLFQTLLQRLEETGVQDDALQTPDAQIIDRAAVPGGAFFPQQKVMVILALFASFAISVLLSVLREFLHPGFRSLSQVESDTGFPALAVVPSIRLQGRQRAFHFTTCKRGFFYGEAIRTLRTNLLLSTPGGAPKVIMLSSSVPNEGKTSVVLSVAAQFADTGRRVIVVDCDLRNPNVGRYLNRPRSQMGLVDYLNGDAEPAAIVAQDRRTGLFYVPAGGAVPQPPDLLRRPRMAALLAKLRTDYDLVLIDSPPLLAVADALVLMRHIDALTYLIRWEETERARARAGLKMAADAGVNIAGVVLTRVNVRKYAKYDDAESGLYFNKAYRNYYVRA